MAVATTRSSRSNNAIAVAVMTLALASSSALLLAGGAGTTVSCEEVVNALVPCGGFLTGAAGSEAPPAGCCQGAQSLVRLATTADARRAMCRCMMQSAPSFGVIPARARTLPARCNVSLDLPLLGGVTDCNK
jgi:hypothetical protein